jgi:hypothetical protein
MERSRKKVRKMPEETDLSFPVPYGEQAKFLQLADEFLALDPGPQDSNVIPINGDRLPSGKSKRSA